MKQFKRRCASAILAVAALGTLATTPAVAATQSAYQSVLHSVEGYWNVDDAGRRAGAVRPEYTPAGQAGADANQKAQADRLARGQVVPFTTYICGGGAAGGGPGIYTISEPWNLTVSKSVVVQAHERAGGTPRFFYIDGRDWPDLSKVRNGAGYSIGHWEGTDLVVETRGQPVTGTRSAKAVMTERFSVSQDGMHLKVTVTNTDPEMLAKPQVYTVPYDRAEEHIYAYGSFCDPNEEPAKTVEPPAQETAAK